MSKPKILNKRHKHGSENFVYVGRPSRWGNPFTHLKSNVAKFQVKTREEAIQKYEEALTKAIEQDPSILEDLKEDLAGKDLECWCYPAPCHASVLLKLANN